MTTINIDSYRDLYYQTTLDYLKQLSEAIKTKNPDELHRLAHSLKGQSYFIGYQEFGHLFHSLEKVMLEVKNQKIPLDDQLTQLVEKVVDTGKETVNRLKNQQNESDYSNLNNSLNKLIPNNS
jgi:chemotaxis protein histidine kinase CheA